MIEGVPLDAVIVASHPDVHYDVLRVTLPARLPTFIEKPPTLTKAKLLDLIELNRDYRTVTAVGLNFSFTDPIKFVKSILAKPEFGHLQYVRISHLNNKPAEEDELWGEVNYMRAFLLSQVIHPLGLLFDLGDDVAWTPEIQVRNSGDGLLVTVQTQLLDRRNSRRFTADLIASSSSPFFNWHLEIIGSGGVIVDVNSLWEVEVYSKTHEGALIDNPKWWRSTWRPSPLSGGFKRNGYEHQFAAFFEDIACDRRGPTSIEHMLPLYELMDRIEATATHE